MPEAADIVLAAFSKKPRMCIHTLMETTGLKREALRYVLVELQKNGMIRNVSEVRGDLIYVRIGEAPVPEDLGLDKEHLPALFGLEEREARNRVIMLKRMKERLIIDWHPVIDVLLGDYERGLQHVEGVRYGTDDDPYNVAK